MRKFLLFWLLILSHTALKAQLDTEHWFAPMSSASGTFNYQGLLYLSTNETTPFQVQIYNNNTVINTVTVSKGNPAQVSIPEDYMIATSPSELFTQVSKGLFVKGSKKFFANYRFSVTNHAEIITSKGLAGLGTTFFAAMAPLTATAYYVNSTIGITATEDNTTIVLSGYNPNVVFADGISAPTRTFTLNKGQSYIIDAVSTDSSYNMNGLVGAKITATNPISVTNGNFNGIYTNNNFTNNDILMDQAVPVDRLGQNFVAVKGNGLVTSGMETLLVIATEDNTQLTINGINTGIVLNTGQYYMVPGSNYINQGNEHYNVGVKASKNIYVYQLLGGTDSGSIYATGGFNYIPPLNCFLPRSVDEIGMINKIGNDTYNAKLNIITQAGANVIVNGSSIGGVNGPFAVNGNTDWVTYSVPNISGNVTVTSTKSVTAGIAAGSGAVGYGGYFAGFSSIPVISKTGDCFHGIILQVDDSYDSYQWYLNGNPIPGATTYFINPELYGPGDYTCNIVKNDCGSKLTEIYTYTPCPPITISNHTIGSCKTLMINPVFTNSSQTIDPSKTQIIVNPANGTANINPATGQITYTPTPGLTTTTTDTFVYYIEGNGNPADFEYFRVNITIDVLSVQNGSLTSCADSSGNALFDLTSLTYTSATGTTVNYFSDAALNNPIVTPNAYISSVGIAYASVTSQYGCSLTAQVTLNTTPAPAVNTANFNGILCDDNFDGIVNVSFNTISNQIVPNATSFNIRYYANVADANAGNTNTLPNNWTYSTTTTIYIRVDALAGNCPFVVEPLTFSIGTPIVLTSATATQDVCDPELDGSQGINLASYISLFTTTAGATATYHNSLAEAQAGTGAVSANQSISGTKVFYLRITEPNGCPNIATLTLNLVGSKQSATLHDETICPSDTVVIDAGSGFTSYLWSTGETTSSIIVGVGNYYVDLGLNGCVFRQNVTVHAAQLPVITSINVSGATATVYATGGNPPFEYSLDGVNYQSSNVFAGLPRGLYTVYVMGTDRCQPVTRDFLILNLVNAITPNGDGINDVLDYSDLKIKKNVSIEVFDRYGFAVYASKDKNYVWNGTINGRPVTSGTYWYVIKWTEPDTGKQEQYSGWVLIKNRN